MTALVLHGALAVAGTPDWLKQAAQTSLSRYPDDTDAIVLLDDIVTTVSAAGEVRTTYRRAYKVLKPAGRNHDIVTVYFDNDTELTFLKAWSITANNEEYELKEHDALETTAFSESLYADTRYKLLQIPGAKPGSVIGYEYQQKQRPFVLQTLWSFQQDIPVRRARFTLDLPSGWHYGANWRNHAALDPQQSGNNRWTWELTDISPISSEPEMPTWRSVAGRLGISFSSTNSSSSWDEIGRWYSQLSLRSNESTSQIREKVRDIVAGADDPIEKLRRLSWYVQHGIRYVAIEIGIGGYQPHAATEVMTNGYGDCKDKATLLKVMLHEIGIDSYYVLINTERDYLAPDFPTPLDFNHVVLAIRLPSNGVMLDAYAALQHHKLGRVLLFDPTDDSTPLGYLPPSLQSNRGLLVADGAGELVTLPLLPATLNRVLRVATLTLDKTGTLKGTLHEVHSGPSAVEMRHRLHNLPKSQRQRVFQHMLTDLVDGAMLSGASMSGLNNPSEPLAMTYDFTASAYAQRAGNLLLFRGSPLGRKGRTLLEGKPRKQPIEFPHTVSEADVVDIFLPPDYELDEMPQAVMYEYPFATYKTEGHITQHVLHYSRSYELKEVRISLGQMEDLRAFFREISDDELSYTILRMRK